MSSKNYIEYEPRGAYLKRLSRAEREIAADAPCTAPCVSCVCPDCPVKEEPK